MEGEAGKTLKKLDDMGIRIEVILPRPPSLQGGAGDLKNLCRSPLGETLGVQLAISFKQVRAFQARPALVAIMIATVLCLVYRLGYLPYRSSYHVRSGGLRMAR
jgi:hypothetical protein